MNSLKRKQNLKVEMIFSCEIAFFQRENKFFFKFEKSKIVTIILIVNYENSGLSSRLKEEEEKAVKKIFG